MMTKFFKQLVYRTYNLKILGIIILACNNYCYSQNIQNSDSINYKVESSLVSDNQNIENQKPHSNFYKTDSIFSFRSPKGYFPSLVHNIGEQASAPFHFKTKQWIITGVSIGITAALIHIDNEVDDWARIQKQKHKFIDKTSPVITEFGDKYGIFSVGAFGLLSAAFNNQKGVQTSLLATQAMVTSGIWVRLIKTITGRERPEANYLYSKSEGGKWYGPFAQYDQDLALKKPGSAFDSFPSGHTSTAFSIATVFALQYNDGPAIPIISYTTASLVGLTRLFEHKHWVSDDFVGALIGYACGKQVVSHYNKTHKNNFANSTLKKAKRTEVSFIQNGDQIGLSIKW